MMGLYFLQRNERMGLAYWEFLHMVFLLSISCWIVISLDLCDGIVATGFIYCLSTLISTLFV